jgi:uncharacterized protein YbaP (TraB family)
MMFGKKGFAIPVHSVDEYTRFAAEGTAVVFPAIAKLKESLRQKLGQPDYEFLGDAAQLDRTFSFLEELATTLSFVHALPAEVNAITLSDQVASWAKGHDPNSGVTALIASLSSFSDAAIPGVDACNVIFSRYMTLWVPAMRQNALKNATTTVKVEAQEVVRRKPTKKK